MRAHWVMAVMAVAVAAFVARYTSVPVMCGHLPASGAVLITGASSGVGRQLALDYAARNWSVVLVARRAAELQEVARECRAVAGAHAAVVPVVGDVGDAHVQAKVRETLDKDLGGALDVAILNHALIPLQLLRDTPDWAQHVMGVMDVNLKSIVQLTQLVLPFLEKGRGSLVAIGTGGEFTPVVGLSSYVISKSALSMFVDHVRLELRRLGTSRVSVNYLILGQVATEQLASKMKEPGSWGWAPTITVSEASSQLMCAINKRLDDHNFVPFHAYWTTVFAGNRWTWPFASMVWESTAPLAL